MALLPKIEKVAVEGVESVRGMAVERLQHVPGCKEFLAGRIDVETSPNILMRLMYRTEKAEFSIHMVAGRRLSPGSCATPLSQSGAPDSGRRLTLRGAVGFPPGPAIASSLPRSCSFGRFLSAIVRSPGVL